MIGILAPDPELVGDSVGVEEGNVALFAVVDAPNLDEDSVVAEA